MTRFGEQEAKDSVGAMDERCFAPAAQVGGRG
jgi:hypothetical protein